MAAQDALTEPELETLLGMITPRSPSGQRNLALLTLLADAGLRLGEALGLNTDDVVREGQGLTHVRLVGKGGQPATAPLTARAAARLESWLQTREASGIGSGPIFCTLSQGRRHARYATDGTLTPGRRLHPAYVRALVGRLAQKAGILRRVSPHTFRHSFATHLLRQTGNLELTRKALRHRRVSTTSAIYSHLADKDVEEAIRDLHSAPQAPADPYLLALAQALAQLTSQQRESLVELVQKAG